MYPTLLDLCGLPVRPDLEGLSLRPQLRDGQAPRNRPAITTHNHDNHSVCSEGWRYIVYADASEELYDRRNDPHEWTNLATDPTHGDVVREHRRWLPLRNRPPAPGSRSRILRYVDGQANWEGKHIRPGDPVPIR